MPTPTLLLLIAGGGLIGFLLAVLGAGGSILLLPLLTSGAGLETDPAIALSLLIVIVLALGNAIPYLKRRQVAPGPAMVLGLPALAGSWIGGSLTKAGIVSDAVQLAVFAAAALVAAWLLLRHRPALQDTDLPLTKVLQPSRSPWPLAAQGLVVGLLTGIAGVGGGFAIVPALVLIAGLPMALASGTSLVLIALNGVVALGATGVWPSAQLPLMLPLLGGGFLGALLGQRLAPRLNEQHLRRGFAALLLGSALFTALEAVDTHRRTTTSTTAHRALTSPLKHDEHEQRRHSFRGGDHGAGL